ncbi:hypothetical protein [Spiribacter onubensis]|uniref:Replication protein n=1 Tax=Spiribacter onubensis TaxID=3122420 RepID=A0ABV3S7X8_9GAMM
MGRYRKIDTRIWNDEKFNELSDDAKLVFFMVLTHPNMTALGAMRHTIAGLAEEMGWSTEGFREAFREASLKGMIEHDPKASVIALPNFIRYNGPESPNVVKAWSTALDLLPESEVTNRVVMRAARLAEDKGEGFAKALPEAFLKDFAKTSPKGMPNQEQEQEQEQEQKKNPPSPPTEKATGGGGDFEEDFCEAYESFPKRKPSHNRKEALRAYQARRRAGVTKEELLAGVQRYAEYIRADGKEGTQYVKTAAAFFGPDEHWAQDWSSASGVVDLSGKWTWDRVKKSAERSGMKGYEWLQTLDGGAKNRIMMDLGI